MMGSIPKRRICNQMYFGCAALVVAIIGLDVIVVFLLAGGKITPAPLLVITVILGHLPILILFLLMASRLAKSARRAAQLVSAREGASQGWHRQGFQGFCTSPFEGIFNALERSRQDHREERRRLKAVRLELGESNQLFHMLLKHLPALAYLKDSQGRYVYLNAAWEELAADTGQDWLGQTDGELWPPELAEKMCANDLKVFTAGKPMTFRETIDDGEERLHLQVTKFPILKNGQPHLLCGVGIDISDRIQRDLEFNRLEAQLLQAQKMEAIGTLAGGIAHDFNNILAAIMGYVEMAQFDLGEEAPAYQRLEQVLKATHRAKDLVGQILSFSRKRDVKKKAFRINPVIKEALKLVRASLPAAIEIHQDLAQEIDPILTDPTLIHQVIMNLCANAAHAMEEKGGRLHVGLQPVKSDADLIHGFGPIPPGRYLLLGVADSGAGMPPDVLKRIFDPFFTTKEKGRGTGMGLAMVQGIVKDHQGFIRVESAPDEGTRVEILLPTIQGDIFASNEECKDLVGGHESILFVDDEANLAELGEAALERLGYQVEARTSPDEALALFSRCKDDFDLVVTDLSMPRMNGDSLTRRIQALRPDIPVILCTGYSENVTPENAQTMGIKALLMKPLSMQELSGTVRAVLDQCGTDLRKAS